VSGVYSEWMGAIATVCEYVGLEFVSIPKMEMQERMRELKPYIWEAVSGMKLF